MQGTYTVKIYLETDMSEDDFLNQIDTILNNPLISHYEIVKTVDDLLDYMEENSFHTPDPGECDCGHCMVYGVVCSIYGRMMEVS